MDLRRERLKDNTPLTPTPLSNVQMLYPVSQATITCWARQHYDVKSIKIANIHEMLEMRSDPNRAFPASPQPPRCHYVIGRRNALERREV